MYSQLQTAASRAPLHSPLHPEIVISTCSRSRAPKGRLTKVEPSSRGGLLLPKHARRSGRLALLRLPKETRRLLRLSAKEARRGRRGTRRCAAERERARGLRCGSEAAEGGSGLLRRLAERGASATEQPSGGCGRRLAEEGRSGRRRAEGRCRGLLAEETAGGGGLAKGARRGLLLPEGRAAAAEEAAGWSRGAEALLLGGLAERVARGAKRGSSGRRLLTTGLVVLPAQFLRAVKSGL